ANDGLVGALIKAGLRVSKVAPPQDRNLSQQQLTRRGRIDLETHRNASLARLLWTDPRMHFVKAEPRWLDQQFLKRGRLLHSKRIHVDPVKPLADDNG